MPPLRNVGEVSADDRESFRCDLALAESDRVIITSDRFETAAAGRAAAWAFDLMKPTSPRWRLLVLGDGPARRRAEAFNTKLAKDDNRVQFLGIRKDSLELLQIADAVWNTRASGGVQFAAEALAAGVPVLGFARNAGLKMLVTPGFNGELVVDPFALAGATMRLFEDKPRHEAWRIAARQSVVEKTITPEAAALLLLEAYARAIGLRAGTGG